ncbi:BTAD domain-containing putative transcriptional regulator [Micromonospora sp. CA-269861]|uniref:BTAD domain-containing putative transcriptional regulator n=1 Tax=Micromonospora sp. CA-269861 TaxID=3239968 RepID=UPI003D8E1065
MRFGMLGPLEVWTAGGKPVRIPELKVRALLADLLVHDGRPVAAHRLIDDLWGDRLPANPASVLRSKMSQLRRALDDAEPGARDLVTHSPAGYALTVGDDAVDVGLFTELVGRARRAVHPRDRMALLTDALALWRGPALADFPDEAFVRPAVMRWSEARLIAQEEWAETALDLGRHADVLADLGDLVERHPLRERFRAARMRALYRCGRQAEALDEFRVFGESMRDELGLDPGPELVALHRALLRQDPALTGPATTPAPIEPERGNLPAPLTGLIGRDAAVADAARLLDAGRLVTLTGPGGVGKTRLAVAVAARIAPGLPAGVWMVEFTTVPRPAGGGRAPSAVIDAVAGTLGLRDDGRSGSACGVDRLVAALRGRRLLLVLDNCEHVVEDVAELGRELLDACPDLRILATSRESLGVPGEVLVLVPPLAPPEAGTATVAELRRSSAAELFLARATASEPGFAPDDENAAAVATVCRRLDGIPLALELAATRVRTMGITELAARLDDRFRLLAAHRRGGPAHHATLRTMIDWSWDLIGADERALLRRLSVFTDGCALSSAEEVCADLPAAGGVSRADVAYLLGRLVDCSLVTLVENADGVRYRMLESVGAYCAERLRESGEDEAVRLRHGTCHAGLAEEADQNLRGPVQRRWLRRLDAEQANLRAALAAAIQRGDAVLALRLACACAWYWVLRGHLGEGRRALAAAAAVPGEAPAGRRALALLWEAGMAALGGDDPHDLLCRAEAEGQAGADPHAVARARWLLASALPEDVTARPGDGRLDGVLSDFRSLGDRWGAAAALSSLAWTALLRGDVAALRRDAERSLEEFRDLGDHWGVLQATNPLAALARMTGDSGRAARLHRDALRIARELGLWPEVSYQLNELGRIALDAGDHAAAGDLHAQARRMAEEQSNLALEQFADLGLAITARRQSRWDAAEQLLHPWLEWNRQAGWHAGVAAVGAELGFVAEQRGAADDALHRHREGFAAARDSGDPRAVALALEGLAGAYRLAGDPVRAARLLGAADAARDAAGLPSPDADRHDSRRIAGLLAADLGPAQLVAERAAGAGAPLDDLLRDDRSMARR